MTSRSSITRPTVLLTLLLSASAALASLPETDDFSGPRDPALWSADENSRDDVQTDEPVSPAFVDQLSGAQDSLHYAPLDNLPLEAVRSVRTWQGDRPDPSKQNFTAAVDFDFGDLSEISLPQGAEVMTLVGISIDAGGRTVVAAGGTIRHNRTDANAPPVNYAQFFTAGDADDENILTGQAAQPDLSRFEISYDADTTTVTIRITPPDSNSALSAEIAVPEWQSATDPLDISLFGRLTINGVTADNLTIEPYRLDNFAVDVEKPTVTNVAVSGTSPTPGYTRSRNVTVALQGEYPEGTIAEWAVAEAIPADLDSLPWVNQSTQNLALTGPEGTATVYAWARDGQGITSCHTTGQIILDLTPPDATFSYSQTTPTREPVTVTATPSEPLLDITPTLSQTAMVNGPVVFSFTDLAGNVGTPTANVDWINRTPPTITIQEPLLSYTFGTEFTPTPALDGVSAIDDIDGDLTDSISVTEHVDYQTLGAQRYRYEVADSVGNVNVAFRSVIIEAGNPITLVSPGTHVGLFDEPTTNVRFDSLFQSLTPPFKLEELPAGILARADDTAINVNDAFLPEHFPLTFSVPDPTNYSETTARITDSAGIPLEASLRLISGARYCDVDLPAGWTQIAMPLDPVETDLDISFPTNLRQGSPYKYNGDQTVPTRQLLPGQGALIYLRAPLTYRFVGRLANTTKTLQPGWQIIGPIGISGTISTFPIRTWQLIGPRMRQSGELVPGRGYSAHIPLTAPYDLGTSE